MTTAPTPSDAERLARGLEEGFCGHAAWLQPAATELRRLQADNERLRAELEAHKPLPLSIERLDELWASQRRFHGGEPLKMGHVEFARLIEVEYGVLGRIPMREENGGQIDHSLLASREVVADGPVRVTRLNLTDEARAGLTSKATAPLPGITGGSS